MKLKIKVRNFDKTLDLPTIIDKGEWVDLRAANTITLKAPQAGTLKRKQKDGKETSSRDVTFDFKCIPLGIAMQLPKGFEAIVAPRSSTFKNYGLIEANSIGIIDNSYSSNSDEWKFPVVAFRNSLVEYGDRICQFRIQLSQKATFWQKLKWFLSSGIKIVEVDDLGNPARGGFGSTGIK